MNSNLVTHCGARTVSREELDAIECPPSTSTWFPLTHRHVLTETKYRLQQAGFNVVRERLALTGSGARFFGTLDLESTLAGGVSLACGIRNSIDKSLPIGFAAGTRVKVCDNLSFTGDIKVTKKHTRWGSNRFVEGIVRAIHTLTQFKQAEAHRINMLQVTPVAQERAESVILKALCLKIVNPAQAMVTVSEWNKPSFDDLSPRTLWSLENAFTYALAKVHESNPASFGVKTSAVRGLISPYVQAV